LSWHSRSLILSYIVIQQWHGYLVPESFVPRLDFLVYWKLAAVGDIHL
jgi:hypothetical protein